MDEITDEYCESQEFIYRKMEELYEAKRQLIEDADRAHMRREKERMAQNIQELEKANNQKTDEMRMRIALQRIHDLDVLMSDEFEEKYGTEGPTDPYVIATKVLSEING